MCTCPYIKEFITRETVRWTLTNLVQEPRSPPCMRWPTVALRKSLCYEHHAPYEHHTPVMSIIPPMSITPLLWASRPRYKHDCLWYSMSVTLLLQAWPPLWRVATLNNACAVSFHLMASQVITWPYSLLTCTCTCTCTWVWRSQPFIELWGEGKWFGVVTIHVHDLWHVPEVKLFEVICFYHH